LDTNLCHQRHVAGGVSQHPGCFLSSQLQWWWSALSFWAGSRDTKNPHRRTAGTSLRSIKKTTPTRPRPHDPDTNPGLCPKLNLQGLAETDRRRSGCQEIAFGRPNSRADSSERQWLREGRGRRHQCAWYAHPSDCVAPKTRLAERNDLNAIGNIAYSDLSTVAIIDLRARLNFRRCVSRARLGQHSRYFWSSEGSTVYKHQKLTLQRAMCSCGPTSVAGLKSLRVSRYCQNARNQAVSPTRRRRATGAEPANSQGSHIVKKPRAHSAVRKIEPHRRRCSRKSGVGCGR
jgi:hypothetical protein